MARLRWLFFAVGLLAVACRAALAGEPRPSPVSISEKAATRLLISQVKPEYPAVARVNYIQGDVILRVIVNPEGKVDFAHILEGEPLLAASSLRAVRQWRFRPLLNGNEPEPFETLIRINFSLRTTQPGSLPPHPQQDLERAVKPPQLMTKPTGSSNLVHIRILVSQDGKVLDSTVIDGRGGVEAARELVRGWKFVPARWGTLTVPWYIEVEVPLGRNQDAREADQAGGI